MAFVTNKMDWANRVYDILVATAGAPSSLREDFVYHHARAAETASEYRFQGSLGTGGKYLAGLNRVSCYPEHMNGAVPDVISATDIALAKLGPYDEGKTYE
jgi:hypothetical protein